MTEKHLKKVLVVYAHPTYSSSRINQALIHGIEQLENVTISNLYEKYPDEKINVQKEQKLIEQADLFILQFPFYWFNTTPLMKKWIDEVFDLGFAYGPDGDKLHGKDFMIVLTIGGTLERYEKDPGFTLPDLLKPFEYMARYCNMVYQHPFIVADPNLLEDVLQNQTQKYVEFLKNYGLHGSSIFAKDYPKFY